MTAVTALISSVSSAAFYVPNSLRFRSTASAGMSRTPSVAGNRQKWTWSGWVKLGTLSATNMIFGAAQTATTGIGFGFQSTGTFYYTINGVGNAVTTAIFQDPAAWYHIVFAFDSTQATAANRAILYVNGVQYTFTTNIVVQNNSYDVNAAKLQYFGSNAGSTYFDGYIAEVNLIDGLQLTQYSFGNFDTNNIWQPQLYTGTAASYGTCGFYLTFNNKASTTTLGNDTSGKGNNWTPANFSLTAGTTYDWMLDSPSFYSASVGNYVVWNPLWQGRTNSPTNANLDYPASSVGISTFGMSTGSYYWEITSTGGATAAAVYGTAASTSISVPSGSTYGLRFNASTGALDYTTDGSTFTSLATGLTSGPYFVYASTAAATTASLNGGQRPFALTQPIGFNNLNTYNLASPTVPNGYNYSSTLTFTGTGASQLLSNWNFYPNLFWWKASNTTGSAYISSTPTSASVDVNSTLQTNSTTTPVNYTSVQGISQIGSVTAGSFYVGTGTVFNTSGNTYTYWGFNAGGNTQTNDNSGTISTSYSNSMTSGLSIISYTGNGTAGATIAHGLGAAPAFVMVKNLTQGANWIAYHSALGPTYGWSFNATSVPSVSATFWNNTSPTSSFISLGTSTSVNTSSNNFIAYAWTAVAGYSSIGTYTGNAAADGPFVYTGFRPQWVMVRNVGATADTYVFDAVRSPFNAVTKDSVVSATTADGTIATAINFLSNGFKITSTNAFINAANKYVYVAFAENPFNSSRAR